MTHEQPVDAPQYGTCPKHPLTIITCRLCETDRQHADLFAELLSGIRSESREKTEQGEPEELEEPKEPKEKPDTISSKSHARTLFLVNLFWIGVLIWMSNGKTQHQHHLREGFLGVQEQAEAVHELAETLHIEIDQADHGKIKSRAEGLASKSGEVVTSLNDLANKIWRPVEMEEEEVEYSR